MPLAAATLVMAANAPNAWVTAAFDALYMVVANAVPGFMMLSTVDVAEALRTHALEHELVADAPDGNNLYKVVWCELRERGAAKGSKWLGRNDDGLATNLAAYTNVVSLDVWRRVEEDTAQLESLGWDIANGFPEFTVLFTTFFHQRFVVHEGGRVSFAEVWQHFRPQVALLDLFGLDSFAQFDDDGRCRRVSDKLVTTLRRAVMKAVPGYDREKFRTRGSAGQTEYVVEDFVPVDFS